MPSLEGLSIMCLRKTELKFDSLYFMRLLILHLGYATAILKTKQTCRGFEVTASGVIRVSEVINAAEFEAVFIIALVVYYYALLVLIAFGYRDFHCMVAPNWFATGPVVDLEEFVVL